MRRLKTAATALVVGFLLVTTLDYAAYAATGKSLVVGKVNASDRATTGPNTGSGPAVEPQVTNADGAPSSVNAGEDTKGVVATSPVPIASGQVDAAGSLSDGVGVEAVTWRGDEQRYVITLTNRAYDSSSLVTEVTPRCEGFTMATLSSADDLAIALRNPAGTAGRCSFAFVTYAG